MCGVLHFVHCADFDPWTNVNEKKRLTDSFL